MSLFRRWGFGAELKFKGDQAVGGMARARRSVRALRQEFTKVNDVGTRLRSGISGLGAALAPLGIGFGLAGAKASNLAANLEAQRLTMRVLVGDLGKANQLLAMLQKNAAATPFKEGDLIEGSKRLLRLTGSNIDRNMELVQTLETLTALNPTKTFVDSVEALLDATAGSGFERLREFGFAFKAEDFSGKAGSAEFADGVIKALQDAMQAATRGEDLVGALSRTFMGRRSTLLDAIENVLKPVGQLINDRLAPPVVATTQLLKDNTQLIVDGFTWMVDRLDAAWNSVGVPVMTAISDAWNSLGRDGKVQLIGLSFALGVVLALLLPVGATLGLVALAGGGLVTILGAAVSVIGFFGSVLTGAASPALAALLAILVPVALAVGAVGLAFASLANRSAFVANELPFVMADAWDGVVQKLRNVRAFALGMFRGFTEGARPFLDQFYGEVQPAFDVLVQLVEDLIGEFGTATTTTRDWSKAGRFLGGIFSRFVIPPLKLVSWIVLGLINLGKILVPVFTGVGRTFRRVATALFGFADGSLSARDAMGLLMITIAQNLLTSMQVVVGTMLRVLQDTLSRIGSLASHIPAVGNILGTGAGLFAVGAGSLADEVDRSLTDTINDLNDRAARIEQRRLDRSPVSVQDGAIAVEAKVETVVCIEENEIARATGAAAASAGERGTGPALPATQRGRVLRHGLTVSPLLPSEAF